MQCANVMFKLNVQICGALYWSEENIISQITCSPKNAQKSKYCVSDEVKIGAFMQNML